MTNYRQTRRIAGLAGLATAIALGISTAPAGATLVCPPGTTDPKYCQNVPPAAITGGAVGVTATQATLKGTAGPDVQGGDTTTYFFEYGTTTSYGLQTPTRTVPPGPATKQVTEVVKGLTPNTMYHYRLVATNADGTTTGADKTFTTRRRRCRAPSRPASHSRSGCSRSTRNRS